MNKQTSPTLKVTTRPATGSVVDKGIVTFSAKHARRMLNISTPHVDKKKHKANQLACVQLISTIAQSILHGGEMAETTDLMSLEEEI